MPKIIHSFLPKENEIKNQGLFYALISFCVHEAIFILANSYFILIYYLNLPFFERCMVDQSLKGDCHFLIGLSRFARHTSLENFEFCQTGSQPFDADTFEDDRHGFVVIFDLGVQDNALAELGVADSLSHAVFC